MSAAIPVRLADGQVLMVPPMRLSWASSQPKLIELMDRVKAELLLGGGATTPEQLALAQAFVAEVCKVCKGAPATVDPDVREVRAIHEALRGIDSPDPTAPDAG